MKVATGIVKRLRAHGFAAYFVGGCVRDMLMRKAPKDFDIATAAGIERIKRIFPRRSYEVGAQFGTILVVRENIPFQVSTFRAKKAKYSTGLLADIRRRDFTINGLAYDPLRRQVIDLVGAKEDIRRRKVRTIGSARQRFLEDPLRLIRAVRFAVTLGFEIEEKTLQAIKGLAGKIRKVSKERIRDELILIFTSPNPALGLTLLEQSGLLQMILPEVAQLKGVKQPLAFHPEGDVFAHTLLMLEHLKRPSLVLAFACLFHDIGKPATFEISDRIRFSGHDRAGAELTDQMMRRLRFSNQDREDVVACVANHMRMMEAPKMRRATLKRLFARPTFEQELRLHHIDCLASHRDLTLLRFLKRKYRQFKKQPLIPKPLLNGEELKKLGFTPGPIFGKIHKQMVDLQLEAKLKNKAQAKRWLKDNFSIKEQKQ